MGLSSNILWHQTKTDSLKQILRTRTFRFAYSKEIIPGTGVTMAFPMVSFCNLPLAEFADYGNKYGGYSIGMSREWGIKNRFNPVLYCENTSNIVRRLASVISNLQSGAEFSDKVLDVLECLAYVKPIEDTLEIGDRKYANYRFMDEREVRLVPDFADLKRRLILPILTPEQYGQYKLEHNNKPLLEESISFEWSDIKYIIVQNNTNITEYRRLLKRLDCNNDNIHIFNQQQVREDFIGIGHNKLTRPFLPKNIDIEKLMKLMITLSQQSPMDNQNLIEKLRRFKPANK